MERFNWILTTIQNKIIHSCLLAYDFLKPFHGDFIVFHQPGFKNRCIRVIGTNGIIISIVINQTQSIKFEQ